MVTQAETVIRERGKGTIVAILHHKEREIDPLLSDEQSARLRRVVLREVNGLVEFALEVLRSVDANPQGAQVVLNQHWLDKIDELHRAVVRGA